MNSVKSAKERLRKYPALIGQCRDSASAYAKCVVQGSNVRKDDCQEQFKRFKNCLLEAAKKNKTKL